MACYAPRTAYRTETGISFNQLSRDNHIGTVQLPCNQCIGCRLDRAKEWSLRIMHEAQLHKRNCFITLTYSEENRPKGLDHSHFQKFIRTLRKRARTPIRYYMCGEYTPENRYPHFHACIFGFDFADAKQWKQNDNSKWVYTSRTLDQCWQRGFATTGELNHTTAGYCARYILQKQTGPNAVIYDYIDDDGVVTSVQPEYNRMSLKPGIGARWLHKFAPDVYSFDYAIDENGNRNKVPRYYDRIYKGDLEETEYQRQLRGQAHAHNNTDERLAVRHEVHKARIRTLRRNLDT